MRGFFRCVAIMLSLTVLLSCTAEKMDGPAGKPEKMAVDVAASKGIQKIAIQAGKAQAKFMENTQALDLNVTKEDVAKLRENRGDNEFARNFAKQRKKWREDNIKTGGLGYFDTVYEFGLSHLDSTAGFEALMLALSISYEGENSVHRVDYKKLRHIQELLYQHYLNQPGYASNLKSIRFSQYVGYPETVWEKEAWAAAKPSRYKHDVMLLERAVKNATNPVVKNHAMLYLAQYYLDNLPEMKDLSAASFGAIVKQNERAEVLLNKVSANTKDNAMPLLATRISTRSLYTDNVYAMYLADQPEPEQETVIPDVVTVYSFAEKALFDLRKFSIGKKLPVVTVPDLEGKPQDLAQYRGRVLLVDFWATWCGPCIAKFPHLRELKKQYAGRPFEIVGISSDKTLELVTEFMQDTEMPWDQLYTGAEDGLIQEWRIPSIPRVYLLDHTGQIIIDNPTTEQLDILLKPLVLQAEQAKINK